MKLLIEGGRLIDPASGLDEPADLALADGRIAAIGPALAQQFRPDQRLDARGCWVIPGLVDLAVRTGEDKRLHSELAAAAAGGVTSLVCPPDTEPVLDEPGRVEMLLWRAEKLRLSRVFPLGALTRGLAGEVLTEMQHLAQSGCVGFGQAEVPIVNTQVLLRALQYASTFGHTVWLRPQDAYLGKGVAASGALATRMGLAGIPVAAETVALHTLFDLARTTRSRVHLCRLSSAAGLELVRQARAEGLDVTCDVSVHSLLLTDHDIGFFDTRARLTPPLRQARDREALSAGLADGSIAALVSDHTPVDDDAKTLPFAEAAPGAGSVELLLALAHRWSVDEHVPLARAIQAVTAGPAGVVGPALAGQSGAGRLSVGGIADLCIYDPAAEWRVDPTGLTSASRYTPFEGWHLPGRVRATLLNGRFTHGAPTP
jgi:dihydroorotase